jgi:uncharacterized protein YdeI (YjbR/CyaY-like superfamily)
MASFRAEDCTFFDSRDALRAWLLENHDKVPVLQLGMYKKASGRPSVTYAEALEEALCFGWIDGVRHPIDEQSFTQRFTPRRKGSNWSAVNVRRVEALIAQGLMHESGLRVFNQRAGPVSSYEDRPEELPEPYLERLMASEAAWRFFSSQPPGYQRNCAFWVMDAKREETRERRLATLIADSEAGKRIGPLARQGERQEPLSSRAPRSSTF